MRRCDRASASFERVHEGQGFSFLFFGTIHAVWFGHRKAFKAASVERSEFMRAMYDKFFSTVKFLHRREPMVTLDVVLG